MMYPYVMVSDSDHTGDEQPPNNNGGPIEDSPAPILPSTEAARKRKKKSKSKKRENNSAGPSSAVMGTNNPAMADEDAGFTRDWVQRQHRQHPTNIASAPDMHEVKQKVKRTKFDEHFFGNFFMNFFILIFAKF